MRRPKSRATVVVDLRSIPLRESIPSLISVRHSSVVSGSISLAAPIMVVLPTPNPPLMMIFAEVLPAAGLGGMESGDIGQPRFQARPQRLQQLQLIGSVGAG
ncbi:hypothetical protein GCM10009735_37690 [Actinomadura chokoriensis]